MMIRRLGARLRCAGAISAIAFLTACGGGGTTSTPAPPSAPAPSPAPTPTPTPTPTPAPTPAPTPTPPATNFQTSEYNRSDGPSYHRAITAWQSGATGKGVAIGIVDSGIDTSNPEFAGRISSVSADVAGTRGVIGDDDHGTMVALVAAAARNNAGVMGIAYDATIMAMRADSPGSCAQTDGCSFSDAAIAAGIDRAVTNGAKVINLSLGGGAAGQQVRSAVGRAASAGVVVIVAAGNDADEKTPSTDPNNPAPFAVSLRAAGNGNVIIAGSVNESGAQSGFSNRAGSEANWYLNALGEQICCEYENGAIKVTTKDGQQFVRVYNGTSFSAPQIAGAAALLRQAFPNLTAAQVVNLLLTTARDAGAAGVDSSYGRGILDIANAFAPQGTTTLAGSGTAVPLGGTGVATSAAMGDALSLAQLRTVVLDSYQRAYSVDLAANGASAPPAYKLTGALTNQQRQVATGTDQLALAFTVDARGGVTALPTTGQLRLSNADAQAAKVISGRIIARLAPGTQLGFAFGQGASGLVAQLRGHSQPAFLIAGDPLGELGFSRRSETAFALRRQLGRWGLTVDAESGKAVVDARRSTDRLALRRDNGTASRFGLALDRRLGPVEASVGASWLSESRTVLGARLHDSLGGGGADSLFVDAGLGWQPAERWRLGAAWRQGFTRARLGGLVASGSSLVSSAWAIDATRTGLFSPNDSLSLRLSQPLRVNGGGLNLSLPQDYDYATLTATSGLGRLALAAHGRELATELAWRGQLAGGWATGSLFYRRDPGHHAALPDDKGVAFSWSSRF